MKFAVTNTKKKQELRITFEGACEIVALKELIEKDNRRANQAGFRKEYSLPVIDLV